jgi:hypothetical protein
MTYKTWWISLRWLSLISIFFSLVLLLAGCGPRVELDPSPAFKRIGETTETVDQLNDLEKERAAQVEAERAVLTKLQDLQQDQAPTSAFLMIKGNHGADRQLNARQVVRHAKLDESLQMNPNDRRFLDALEVSVNETNPVLDPHQAVIYADAVSVSEIVQQLGNPTQVRDDASPAAVLETPLYDLTIYARHLTIGEQEEIRTFGRSLTLIVGKLTINGSVNTQPLIPALSRRWSGGIVIPESGNVSVAAHTIEVGPNALINVSGLDAQVVHTTLDFDTLPLKTQNLVLDSVLKKHLPENGKENEYFMAARKNFDIIKNEVTLRQPTRSIYNPSQEVNINEGDFVYSNYMMSGGKSLRILAEFLSPAIYFSWKSGIDSQPNEKLPTSIYALSGMNFNHSDYKHPWWVDGCNTAPGYVAPKKDGLTIINQKSDNSTDPGEMDHLKLHIQAKADFPRLRHETRRAPFGIMFRNNQVPKQIPLSAVTLIYHDSPHAKPFPGGRQGQLSLSYTELRGDLKVQDQKGQSSPPYVVARLNFQKQSYSTEYVNRIQLSGWAESFRRHHHYERVDLRSAEFEEVQIIPFKVAGDPGVAPIEVSSPESREAALEWQAQRFHSQTARTIQRGSQRTQLELAEELAALQLPGLEAAQGIDPIKSLMELKAIYSRSKPEQK